MFNRKGISPVVATTLLLVVAVLSVVGFMSWFESFQSSNLVDVERQSSSGKIYTSVDQFIGDTLYIKNGYDNLSINDISVDGISCGINMSSSDTLIKISLAGNSCINFTSSTPDFVVYTKEGVFSKKEYIKSVDTILGGGGGGGSPSLDCSTIPYGDWILVPGNVALGTSDFCVMKYEAKNVGGIANSTASGTPWVSLTWQQAKTNCEALGTDYHLITDNEWLTIAKNAENIATNWNSSVVGTGFIYLGHNDNNPANSLPADINDSNGYYGTNDGVSSPGDGNFTNFPSNDARAYQGQKRTLTLSNGEVIWDLAGNVWEWVNDSMPIASRYHGGDQRWMSYSSDDGTGKIASLVPALMTPSSGWNANNGMGRYYDGFSLAGAYNSISEAPDFCTGYCSPTAVFLRGGTWDYGAYAGAFALLLYHGPSASGALSGFRCTYTL
jgi:formylglycine-generating enzyme required for sulfatase activity